MSNPIVNHIIDCLYQWVTTYKNRELLKDTTKISSKVDAMLVSTIADPLSVTIFELSDKGELLIDDVTRFVESEAAFYLFVNTNQKWIIAVKNTNINQARLVKGESVENYMVKLVL